MEIREMRAEMERLNQRKQEIEEATKEELTKRLTDVVGRCYHCDMGADSYDMYVRELCADEESVHLLVLAKTIVGTQLYECKATIAANDASFVTIYKPEGAIAAFDMEMVKLSSHRVFFDNLAKVMQEVKILNAA